MLGSVFEPARAATLAGVATPEALRHCASAHDAGLLLPAGRNYEFANDVLRELVYAATPEPTRYAHHARAADLFPDSPEQVAEHAAAGEDWVRAGRAWLRAAEQALAGHALKAATRSGERDVRARALVAGGRAAYVMGQYAGAGLDRAAAVEAARDAGDRRLEMVALREYVGDLHVALGRSPGDTEEPLRACLRLAESLGDRDAEADVVNRLAVLATNRLDFAGALALGAQGLRAGRPSGRSRPLIYGLDAMKTAYAYLGEIDRLAAIIAELEPLERADGDLMLLQWTVFESFIVPLARGDHPAALTRIEAALALNRRSGQRAFEPFFVARLGWVHRLAGDLEAAESVGARAVEAAHDHPHAWWLATASSMYATTLIARGRVGDAAHEVRRVLPSIEVAGAEAYRLRCLGALVPLADGVLTG